MHGNYQSTLDALHTALAGVGLTCVVDVEGPNRLGGFRLTDGGHRVALSFVPSRKSDGRDWWVSAWVPAESTTEIAAVSGMVSAAPDEMQNPRSERREIALPEAMARDDAVIAAIQLLVEQRIRTAWKRIARERDEIMARMMADTIASLAYESHQEVTVPSVPSAKVPASTGSNGGTVFHTAPRTTRVTGTNGHGAAATALRTPSIIALEEEDEFGGA